MMSRFHLFTPYYCFNVKFRNISERLLIHKQLANSLSEQFPYLTRTSKYEFLLSTETSINPQTKIWKIRDINRLYFNCFPFDDKTDEYDEKWEIKRSKNH